MVYLKDEATGVTVEDDRLEAGSISFTDQMNEHQSATLRALWPAKACELFEWLSHVVPESVGSEEEMADAMLGRSR